MGLWRNADHEYWVSALLDEDHFVEVGPLVSVTTALKALDKSGPLVGWATRETAAAAIRNLDALVAMVKESPGPAGLKAAQEWLQKKPGYIKETAADLGTDIHQLIEAIALGHPISEEQEALPKVRQYRRWIAEAHPEFVGVEQMCVSFTEAYAGTADIWCRLYTDQLNMIELEDGRVVDGPELWLLDAKTGKGTYPDMALQLAGLNGAEWWGWPDRDTLEPAPKADRFGILHLQDDDYKFIEYEVTDAEYQTFLAIKKAHEWTQGRAKEVVLGTAKREKVA